MTDPVFTAKKLDTLTGQWTDVEAQNLYRPGKCEPDPGQIPVKLTDHFYCAACYEKHHRVRLNFVSKSQRRTSFHKLDKKTGEVRRDAATNSPEGFNKSFAFPSHFITRANEPEHLCDIKYNKYKDLATRMNARPLEKGVYIWPVIMPGRRLHRDDAARQGDIRQSLRFAGLGLGGISSPEEFQRLLEQYEDDPVLRRAQKFHDGLRLRALDDIYFEEPAALYAFLDDNREKFGYDRHSAVPCFVVVQPNTYYKALMGRIDPLSLEDRRRPQIVRNNQKIAQVTTTLKPMNRTTFDAARRACATHQANPDGKIIVLAEASLAPQPGHIHLEIFSPVQVIARNPKISMVSQIDANGQKGLAI